MRVFLSYSRSDKETVELVRSALNAAGYDTFLDTADLPIGQEYNARIKRAVDESDLFVFLASDRSVRPGSYAMAELAFAEAKWRNPSGYVLPVLVDGFDAARLPAYINPINAPVADKNIGARIVGWVEQRIKGQDPDGLDDSSPRGRLERWARLAQPPVRPTQRAFLWSGPLGVVIGVFFIGMGLFGAVGADDLGGTLFAAVGAFFAVVGAALILYSIWRTIQGMLGSKSPIAVVILDRESRENSVWLQVETHEGKRLKLRPMRAGARRAHAGDLGWAYIRGDMLIEFVPVSKKS